MSHIRRGYVHMTMKYLKNIVNINMKWIKPDKKAVLFKVDKELIRQEGTQRYQKRMN